MAIEGPIPELAPGDLLQLLHLSRRSGRLRAEHSDGTWVEVRLRDGALSGASASTRELQLGWLLVNAGCVTAAQLDATLERESEEDTRIGEALAAAGLVPVREIERHLTFQVEEAILDLLRATEGRLRFDESEDPPGEGIEIRLRTDAVLMDAARRLDELAEVSVAAGGTDPIPRLADAANGPLALDPLEWEVLGAVDGARSVRSIARDLGRGEVEVARALYNLAESGVVELRRKRAEDADAATVAEIEAAIAARRFEAAAAHLPRLDPAIGEHRRALLEGRIEAGRGAWARALIALEHAAGGQGAPAEARYHLARVAILAGEFERAIPALEVYQRLNDPSLARRAAATRMAAAIDELTDAARSGEP